VRHLVAAPVSHKLHFPVAGVALCSISGFPLQAESLLCPQMDRVYLDIIVSAVPMFSYTTCVKHPELSARMRHYTPKEHLPARDTGGDDGRLTCRRDQRVRPTSVEATE
jgi:hypothetical protein